MSTYTVVEAHPKRQNIDGKYGLMQEIEMVLRNPAGVEKTVEWFTKQTTQVPTPGTEVEGDVAPDDKFPDKLKFKKAQQQNNYGGGNRPRDPAERASIERQVAAKVASDLLVALMEKANWSPDQDALLEQHARYAKRIAEGIAQ